MQYQLNHVSGVEKELSISFTANEVNENLVNSYKRVAKTANIKGFRPGKVPMHVVKQIYGKSVIADVEHHFVTTALQEAAMKENLHIINTPVVDKRSEIEEDSDYSLNLKFEVFPQVVVNKRTFEAEYTPVPYKNEYLDEELEAVKRRLTEYKNVERASADGDRVVINFEGRIDGKIVEGTVGNDVPVVLGSGGFIKDFEVALFGKSAGEKFDADVTFPADYHSKDLAGKTVVFSVEVISVEEGSVPELNDELIKEKNLFDGTMAEFRLDLEKRIREYIEGVNRDNKKYIVTDKLVSMNEVEIPKSFLEAEIKVREEDYKKKNNVEEIPAEAKDKIVEDANWVSKRFLILSQLAKDLHVSVSDEELDKSLAVDAARYNVGIDVIKRVYDKERLNERRMTIQEDKVLGKVMENVTFIEKEPKE